MVIYPMQSFRTFYFKHSLFVNSSIFILYLYRLTRQMFKQASHINLSSVCFRWIYLLRTKSKFIVIFNVPFKNTY